MDTRCPSLTTEAIKHFGMSPTRLTAAYKRAAASSIATQSAESASRFDRELAMLRGLFVAPSQGQSLGADLAWDTPLDDEERQEMKQELATALVAAPISGDWSAYDDALYAWQATADVLRDPALTARLLDGGDSAQEVPLKQPCVLR